MPKVVVRKVGMLKPNKSIKSLKALQPLKPLKAQKPIKKLKPLKKTGMIVEPYSPKKHFWLSKYKKNKKT